MTTTRHRIHDTVSDTTKPSTIGKWSLFSFFNTLLRGPLVPWPQKFYLCTRASLLRSLTLHSLSRSDAHTDPQPGTTFETIEKALAAVNRRRGKKTRPRIPRRSRCRSSRPAAAEPGRRRPEACPTPPHSAPSVPRSAHPLRVPWPSKPPTGIGRRPFGPARALDRTSRP